MTLDELLDIKASPANIKTVKIRIRKRGQYRHATVTVPQDVISRYNIEDGQDIVICYLCKAEEEKKRKK
jgi:hypothetical protein